MTKFKVYGTREVSIIVEAEDIDGVISKADEIVHEFSAWKDDYSFVHYEPTDIEEVN